MPTISTSTTITLPAGQKLVISGAGATATATVNPGSLAQIYDVGVGQDILGPFDRATPVRVEIRSGSVTYNTVSEGATAVLDNGGALTLPNGTQSPAGGSLAAAINSICESYARSKDRNPRVNATIRSCELVSDTIYADSAALQTAFPAASNANKGGKVGTASSYVIQTSDGTSWTTPAVGVMGYLRSGVSTTGYTATTCLPAGAATQAPASNGAQLLKPFRQFGALPNPAAGGALSSAGPYTKAGARTQSATSRLVFVTDEPEPIVTCTGSSSAYVLSVDLEDGSGARAVVDPAITTNPTITNQAFFGASGGGLNNIKLDVSQLGGFGRRKRTCSVQMFSDVAILDVRIKAVSSYFTPPASPKIILVTDSIGGTINGGNMKDCYPPVMQDFSGVHDIFLASEGGSGFVNTNGGVVRTHLEKVQNLAEIPQYADADLVILAASTNDAGLPGITDAATAAINAALATRPKALIAVMGPPGGVGLSIQTSAIAIEQSVKAAVDAVASPRVVWIPQMTDTPQAVRGTGRVNSPTGDGNCDLMYRTGDDVHPAPEGHLIWARDYVLPKLISALRAWVESQA